MALEVPVGIPALVLLMALEVQEMGLEAPEEHLVAQGMERVQLTVAQVTALATEQVQAERQTLETVAMAQVVATEERQALETAAMAAQERAMAAVVEMEALAMELGLEPTDPQVMVEMDRMADLAMDPQATEAAQAVETAVAMVAERVATEESQKRQK